MKRRLLLLLLIFPGIAAAQDGVQPTPNKPSPPFVSAMPANIEFIKTFSYPAVVEKPGRTAEQAAAQKFLAGFQRMQVMDTVKVGDVSKTLCTFTDGTSVERWMWKNCSIEVNSKLPAQVVVIPISKTDNVARDNIPTFAEVSWVGLAFYTGEQFRQNHRYFTYKKGDQSAWIDEDTTLPAFFVSAPYSIVYTYKATPTGPLELPENMKKQLTISQNSWRGAPAP